MSYTGASACTINLTTPLTITAGQTVTVDGGSAGLVLEGSNGGSPVDVIDITDTSTSRSTLTLTAVTVKDGHNGIIDPGGLATIKLNGSTVSDDSGTGIITGTTNVPNGTGILAGTAIVPNSTVSGNSGVGVGANISATVTSSTVSGNNEDGIAARRATVTSSTISGNGSAGIVAGRDTLTANILASNYDGNCIVTTLTDDGYNLSTDSSCDFDTAKHSANNVPLTSASPGAGINFANGGTPGNYGGPTQTIALGPGSIAIDAIPTNAQGECLDANNNLIVDPATTPPSPITTDQRGITRPQGAKCDIGAYEAPAVTITTTPDSPSASGWFNASQLSLVGSLLVDAGFSGLATGNLPGCTGANFAGLPAAAVSGLNQKAGGSASLGDGTYSITCGVSQRTTALGVSSNVTQPLTLQVDSTDPAVHCSPTSSSSWFDQNVTVNCTASDATSGLAQGSPSSFNLSTTVATGTADQAAKTTSQTICDLAGNCVIAGPYSFMVDLAPPTITSPAANGQYLVNQAATLTCADVGSGIKTCAASVTEPSGTTVSISQGSPIPTGQPGTYTVTPNRVTDNAGNADPTSFSYTVGYRIVTLPGTTQTVNRGYYAVLRIAPEDASGHDDASRTLSATSVELDGPNGQVIPFVYTFRFGRFGRQAGYQLALNTRNLSRGEWSLKFQFAGDPTVYGVTFRVE